MPAVATMRFVALALSNLCDTVDEGERDRWRRAQQAALLARQQALESGEQLLLLHSAAAVTEPGPPVGIAEEGAYDGAQIGAAVASAPEVGRNSSAALPPMKSRVVAVGAIERLVELVRVPDAATQRYAALSLTALALGGGTGEVAPDEDAATSCEGRLRRARIVAADALPPLIEMVRFPDLQVSCTR